MFQMYMTKVIAAGKQRRSHMRRRIQQIAAAEGSLGIDHRRASGMPIGVSDEWNTVRHTQTLCRLRRIVYRFGWMRNVA
jgi:hypothetical protein